MKIAINGFGRIGRLMFRLLNNDSNIEIVAINDLTSAEDLAYLLKYDSNQGSYLKDQITFDNNTLIVGNKRIAVYNEKDPKDLPWKKLNIDLVIESTGKYTSYEKAYAHIEAGAKKVIISAPGKDMKTIVYGVNHDTLTKDDIIISAASCTTNALAPILKLINDTYTIKTGFISTVHAYTNDQSILDIAHKKGINSRRGRAAATNIIPTSTGAASAIGNVIPSLKGKLDGIAFRVPVPTSSSLDITLKLAKKTSVEELNKLFENNKNSYLDITYDPIVSQDVTGTTYATIIDGQLTNIITTDDEQLVKIISWYDNEMGYSAQMYRTINYLNNLK